MFCLHNRAIVSPATAKISQAKLWDLRKVHLSGLAVRDVFSRIDKG
jgi:hypothetical protein